MKNTVKVMVKKLEEYEWFCPEPFTNITNSITGLGEMDIPCCHINHIKWNRRGEGEDIKSFRKEFINGGGPLIDKFCTRCIKQEESGNKSFRQNYLDNFGGKFAHKKKELEENLDNPPLLTMEFKAHDNLCNLRCNMCKSILSSSLAKENLSLGKPIHHRLNNNPHFKKESKIPNLKNLLELKLVGGETLAISDNYKVMEKCSDDVVVRITTNGTVTPKFNGKDIFDYIPKFKKFIINVSIEFWGERNNYLRFPSKWERIIGNVKRFKSFDNCEVNYHSTINALNVGYMLDIIDNADCPFSLDNLVYGDNEIYSIVSVPPDIREQYLERYYLDYRKETDTIITYLENIEHDEFQMTRMLQDIKDRDKYRGTCLIDLFPEWKKYYEKL
tara:strand:- start:548 stop:1708 length:1161 start_codon:yes stop_codon:yes gene_type:complete